MESEGEEEGEENTVLGFEGKAVLRVVKKKRISGVILEKVEDGAWRIAYDDQKLATEVVRHEVMLDMIYEARIVEGARVQGKYNNKWYPATIESIRMRKKLPYGVICDADKHRRKKLILWLARDSIRFGDEPTTTTSPTIPPVSTSKKKNNKKSQEGPTSSQSAKKSSRKNSVTRRRSKQKAANKKKVSKSDTSQSSIPPKEISATSESDTLVKSQKSEPRKNSVTRRRSKKKAANKKKISKSDTSQSSMPPKEISVKSESDTLAKSEKSEPKSQNNTSVSTRKSSSEAQVSSLDEKNVMLESVSSEDGDITDSDDMPVTLSDSESKKRLKKKAKPATVTRTHKSKLGHKRKKISNSNRSKFSQARKRTQIVSKESVSATPIGKAPMSQTPQSGTKSKTAGTSKSTSISQRKASISASSKSSFIPRKRSLSFSKISPKTSIKSHQSRGTLAEKSIDNGTKADRNSSLNGQTMHRHIAQGHDIEKRHNTSNTSKRTIPRKKSTADLTATRYSNLQAEPSPVSIPVRRPNVNYLTELNNRKYESGSSSGHNMISSPRAQRNILSYTRSSIRSREDQRSHRRESRSPESRIESRSRKANYQDRDRHYSPKRKQYRNSKFYPTSSSSPPPRRRRRDSDSREWSNFRDDSPDRVANVRVQLENQTDSKRGKKRNFVSMDDSSRSPPRARRLDEGRITWSPIIKDKTKSTRSSKSEVNILSGDRHLNNSSSSISERKFTSNMALAKGNQLKTVQKEIEIAPPPKRGLGAFAFIHNDGYDSTLPTSIVNSEAHVGKVTNILFGSTGMEAEVRWYVETKVGSRIYREYSPENKSLKTWTVPLDGLKWLDMQSYHQLKKGYKLGYESYQEMRSIAKLRLKRKIPIPWSIHWDKTNGSNEEEKELRDLRNIEISLFGR